MKHSVPSSNYGPCMCQPQKGDGLEGIPDHIQRPARKEVSLGSIGPNKEASGKGYKVVEVRSGGEPVGFPGGNGKRRRKGMEEDEEDYD
jgi:hypothetical protein